MTASDCIELSSNKAIANPVPIGEIAIAHGTIHSQ